MILGLYIHHGLIRTEINQLQVHDVNLSQGTIHIRKNIKLNERILTLAAHQVLQLHTYINTIRPELIKQSTFEKGNRLFFTRSSGENLNDTLKKLLKKLKKHHLELQSFHQVRSSVISNWIKEKPIREVQYMAGHNSLMSTQRYKDVDMQDLQTSLDTYHPLK